MGRHWRIRHAHDLEKAVLKVSSYAANFRLQSWGERRPSLECSEVHSNDCRRAPRSNRALLLRIDGPNGLVDVNERCRAS